MKLFECDICPNKLKCKLLSKKDELIKKYWGDETFKIIWESFDKINNSRQLCQHWGYCLGVNKSSTKVNEIFGEIKSCVLVKLEVLEKEYFEKKFLPLYLEQWKKQNEKE